MLDYCLNGQSGGCTAANPQRIQFAKSLNKDFIDRVLSRSSNRIALTSFSTMTSGSTPYTVGFSANAAYLKSQVDAYVADGPLGASTCVCAGIRRARKLLESAAPAKNKFLVVLTDGVNNKQCEGSYPDLNTVDTYLSDFVCCTLATSCGKSTGIGPSPPAGCHSGLYEVINYAQTGCNKCGDITGGFYPACGDYVDYYGINQAISDAQATNNAFTGGVKIYTIGMFDQSFGSGCTQATTSLTNIAAKGNGQFFKGTSKAELEAIYAKF